MTIKLSNDDVKRSYHQCNTWDQANMDLLCIINTNKTLESGLDTRIHELYPNKPPSRWRKQSAFHHLRKYLLGWNNTARFVHLVCASFWYLFPTHIILLFIVVKHGILFCDFQHKSALYGFVSLYIYIADIHTAYIDARSLFKLNQMQTRMKTPQVFLVKRAVFWISGYMW